MPRIDARSHIVIAMQAKAKITVVALLRIVVPTHSHAESFPGDNTTTARRDQGARISEQSAARILGIEPS